MPQDLRNPSFEPSHLLLLQDGTVQTEDGRALALALLSGNTGDDAYAISAGTGQKLSLSSLAGTINGGTP